MYSIINPKSNNILYQIINIIKSTICYNFFLVIRKWSNKYVVSHLLFFLESLAVFSLNFLSILQHLNFLFKKKLQSGFNTQTF